MVGMSGSFTKYVKMSDGFFAQRDWINNTTQVFRPANPQEKELLVIVPTQIGGWTWFSLVKQDQRVLVKWCVSGELFRSYPYRATTTVYDFLLNVVKDLDLVEAGHHSKCFKFVNDATDFEIDEEKWRNPMRSLFTDKRPENDRLEQTQSSLKGGAKPVAKVQPQPAAKAKGVKKRPGKKA